MTVTDTKTDAPEAPEPQIDTMAASRRRGLTGLSRLQVTGIVFAVLGLVVALLVAPALPADDVTFSVGLGDLAPAFAFDPPNATIAMAVLMILLGAVGIADRLTRRWASLALLVAAGLLVPLVLVASLALSSRGQTNLLPLLVESLRLGTPIALGSLAGLWSERSGVVNIGIEGMMLAGAGVGFVAYGVMNAAQGGVPLFAAVVMAVAVGGLLGALHAVLCVTFRTDQIVSGVVINLLALGVTAFLRRQVLLARGVGSGETLPTWEIPLLSDIPVVGSQLFVGKPIFFSMFVIFVATQWVLFRTPWGLRVRSVGENPHAAETLGIDVIKTRYQAVVLGGFIAGLAGAWFTLETVGDFDNGMTNGAGFIALAALIFGKWRPWPAFGGAMLFGFANALASRIQLLGVEVGDYPVPSPFLQALPFVVTVVVLAGAIGRAIPPAAVGVPYERSR
jgi:simple sugar transport system permease protein